MTRKAKVAFLKDLQGQKLFLITFLKNNHFVPPECYYMFLKSPLLKFLPVFPFGYPLIFWSEVPSSLHFSRDFCIPACSSLPDFLGWFLHHRDSPGMLDHLVLPISLLPLLIWNFHLRCSCSRLFTKDGLAVDTGTFFIKKERNVLCFLMQKRWRR